MAINEAVWMRRSIIAVILVTYSGWLLALLHARKVLEIGRPKRLSPAPPWQVWGLRGLASLFVATSAWALVWRDWGAWATRAAANLQAAPGPTTQATASPAPDIVWLLIPPVFWILTVVWTRYMLGFVERYWGPQYWRAAAIRWLPAWVGVLAFGCSFSIIGWGGPALWNCVFALWTILCIFFGVRQARRDRSLRTR